MASNCDFYTLQVTEVSVKSNTLQLRNSVYSEWKWTEVCKVHYPTHLFTFVIFHIVC